MEALREKERAFQGLVSLLMGLVLALIGLAVFGKWESSRTGLILGMVLLGSGVGAALVLLGSRAASRALPWQQANSQPAGSSPFPDPEDPEEDQIIIPSPFQLGNTVGVRLMAWLFPAFMATILAEPTLYLLEYMGLSTQGSFLSRVGVFILLFLLYRIIVIELFRLASLRFFLWMQLQTNPQDLNLNPAGQDKKESSAPPNVEGSKPSPDELTSAERPLKRHADQDKEGSSVPSDEKGRPPDKDEEKERPLPLPLDEKTFAERLLGGIKGMYWTLALGTEVLFLFLRLFTVLQQQQALLAGLEKGPLHVLFSQEMLLTFLAMAIIALMAVSVHRAGSLIPTDWAQGEYYWRLLIYKPDSAQRVRRRIRLAQSFPHPLSFVGHYGVVAAAIVAAFGLATALIANQWLK
ncbi:MAG: hypothetical protein QXD60_03730 [Nanopusillaceae archaeon]